MKKIIVCLFAVAFAAMTQAASVTWMGSTTGLEGKTSYTAYLVDAASYTAIADAVTAIMKDGSRAAGMMYSANANYSSGNVAVAQQNKQLPEGYEKNQEVYYWSILFDGTVGEGATAENYYNLSATAADVGAATYTKISTGELMTDRNTNVTAGAWMPVPEPTSGLLLLIGMGALALRRKRA